MKNVKSFELLVTELLIYIANQVDAHYKSKIRTHKKSFPMHVILLDLTIFRLIRARTIMLMAICKKIETARRMITDFNEVYDKSHILLVQFTWKIATLL